ncbi:alpha/beta hydrolase [Zooshikella ganghwensis]|uniref:alpha/beta hydrolase n=1 Tax=Zooshikella ganghwensis TaxID=202772 RepID=UPI000420B481|nr:alpha/beta hydrolase [Zooshikella ganghwensis]
MRYMIGFLLLCLTCSSFSKTLDIYDTDRDRYIPISVDFPSKNIDCSTSQKCNVAFISAGNKVPYQKYQFITQLLNSMSYMTVAIDHELPNDPPLSTIGDLFKTRIENWQRGATTLDFLQRKLPNRFPEYNFHNIILVGHSNGGDISAWLANKGKPYISKIVTLDNRRVTLPKTAQIQVLSIRATEYPTAESVLLTEEEQDIYHSCIIEIESSKHMDLSDYGSISVKQRVESLIKGFLSGQDCNTLKSRNIATLE